MPMDFRDMHASSGHPLAKILQDLSAKLAQGANSVGHAPSLPKMKALEDDVRSALAILRRHINPLVSPLYRLPPDLFPEVASHLASEADLVKATHVSYHLRNTLLSYPSLWSHLNFKYEKRARAFFERSGRVPLHVDMAKDVTRTVDSLTELRQQSKRIAALKLGHWFIQKKFLSEPLPSLRRLKISFRYLCDDEWADKWDTVWAPVWGPTEKVTSWSFPSLTTLVVDRLSPVPFYTPRLTRFKFWDREDSTNVGALISFLGSCPLLEHINISYESGFWNKHDLVVSLPNLCTYAQTNFSEAYSLMVLNALSLPPSCSVTLRIQNDDNKTATAGGVLPHLKNPDYLAEIKRVKLKTAHDANGNGVAGTLELINAKGMRVRFERMIYEGEDGEVSAHTVAHLDFLRNLDGRSVEVLCIDGHASWDGEVVKFLKEALGSGNVRTLILSRSAVESCLSALNEDPGASGHSRWFSQIRSLIIHTGPKQRGLWEEVLRPLLSVAGQRKALGFPFRSVSLFLRSGPEWYEDQVLEKLREYVEKLEVVKGDDVLDWDVDKYFLDGLEHLQENRDVQWD